ncbi:MAG: NADH-quinone oxidoreductase subunit NuoE [Marinobacter sp.]|jgi:NADH-quinone oxidoreductase subunit E
MLRRLYHDQPESFAFTPANLEWAQAQITKYPEGRQASAVIPLLWRAQEQEGWLSRPAIEGVAKMLDMASIRVLEVATFYFMFQLQPVGTVAHIQVCGTTSCMICGAEDLIAVCKDKIAPKAHQVSADGRFSWEEVECLGACTNAPMAQIGKDYYEDLTAEKLADLLDAMGQGEVPVPGPQNGRFSCEPLGGPVVLTEGADDRPERNASVALALELGDTLKRIDGTEVPLTTPWQQDGQATEAGSEGPISNTDADDDDTRSDGASVDDTGIDKREAPVHSAAEVAEDVTPAEQGDDTPDTARGQSMQEGSDTGAEEKAAAAGTDHVTAEGTANPPADTPEDPSVDAGNVDAGPAKSATPKTAPAKTETAKSGTAKSGAPASGSTTSEDARDARATAKTQGGAGKASSTPTDSQTNADASNDADDLKAVLKAEETPNASEDDAETGTRPDALDGPRDGKADNLKEIKGVGPKLETQLNEMGIYHFEQIANWTTDEIAWVDTHLVGFKGRVTRDDWVAQAKTLAAGGDTEFSKRVDKGDVY